MLFSSLSGRHALFEELSFDPTSVRYGSAMDHAASTNLGIWGSESDLMLDCAQIMVFEVRKYKREIGDKEPFKPHAGQLRRPFGDSGVRQDCLVEVNMIVDSRVFNLAFSKARSGPERRVGAALDALGVEGHNMSGARRREVVDVNLKDLHVQLYNEMKAFAKGREYEAGRRNPV